MFTESGWHGGLTGRYYGNEDFTGVVAGRIDYGISFDWADETPDVIAAFNPSYPDNAREWIYKVSLYFAEPHSLGIGDRVFEVELEGEMVLKDFDTVKEAGGVRRLIVKEFDSVRTGPVLNLSLVPNKGRTLLCGIKLALQ